MELLQNQIPVLFPILLRWEEPQLYIPATMETPAISPFPEL